MTATHWWQPGKPERALPGVLLEDGEHGWVLQLDGDFEDSDVSVTAGGQPTNLFRKRPNVFPVVVGSDSQGHQISLMDCQVLDRSLSIFPMTRSSLKLWPTVLAFGVHFESAEDFRITSLSIHYSNLDTWVGTSGFTINSRETFYPVESRYARPEPVECELSDGLKIGVDFSASGPNMMADSDLRITQRSWLSVSSTTDLSFNDILEKVNDLANMVCLAVGEPLRPLEMSAFCNAKDSSGAIVSASLDLIYNRKVLAPMTREVFYGDMLFRLPNVRERFVEFIRAWCERDAACRSLSALYFSTIRSPFMYVEQRFLSLFQALESFDRRTSEVQPEKVKLHKVRIDRILQSVDALDSKWLKHALRFSHEPRAADRIRHVVETLHADWLLSKEQVELCASLRNYYTHFDPKSDANLPVQAKRILVMVNLAARLRVLCELVLLRVLGFSPDEMRKVVEATRRLDRHMVDEGAPE